MQESVNHGMMPTKYDVTHDQLLRIHLAVEEARAELKDVIHLNDVWLTITYMDTQGNKRVFYTEKV